MFVLQLENDCGNVLLMFTSPGDDYDSPDKVKEYTIKYSKFASNLTEVKPLDKNRIGHMVCPPKSFTLKLDLHEFERNV